MNTNMMFKSLFKVGKKLCFPDSPSSWIPRTVEAILRSQCYCRRKDLSHPETVFPPPPELSSGSNSVEEVEKVITHDGGFCYNHCCCYGGGKDDGVIYTKDAFLWAKENYFKVENFMSTQSKYTLEEYQEYVILKGSALDVISLLSTTKYDKGDSSYLVRNNGDKVVVDSLRGKNIVICCFYVPCFYLSVTASAIRGIITACSHRLKNNGGYEMVMVAKMRRNWANDEDAFNHFFSGFPTSWLTVPFSDTLRRDHICDTIGLRSGCDPRGLLIDPNQNVLVHEDISTNNGFTYDPFCLVDWYEHDTWWETHSQLDSILESDFVYKVNTNTEGIDGYSKVSISELRDKLVGLYLCYNGSLIRTLDMVSQECKARNKEFHVVLVYLPYGEKVDPPLFQEAINHVLHNLRISTNWWISPFNDIVSRRIWEVVYCTTEDQLVVLDPHMNVVDCDAKRVIDVFGINSYPFTRDFIVRRELEAIRAVTLESLLAYGSRDYVLRITDDGNNESIDQVPITQLQGKIVLLYIGQVEKLSHRYYTLLEWYNWTKTTKVADFEVVFVQASPSSSPRPMPWLMCPFEPQHVSYVMRKIFNNRLDSLTAFDKDGHIITLDALDLLDAYGPVGFPPYYGLRNEVVGKFMCYDLDMEDVFDN